MSESITTLVFDASPPPRVRSTVLGVAAGVALHAALLAWASFGGPSLGAWAAEMAIRVHAEVSRTEAVDLPRPAEPPPPPPPAAAPPPEAAAERRAAPP